MRNTSGLRARLMLRWQKWLARRRAIRAEQLIAAARWRDEERRP